MIPNSSESYQALSKSDAIVLAEFKFSGSSKFRNFLATINGMQPYSANHNLKMLKITMNRLDSLFFPA